MKFFIVLFILIIIFSCDNGGGVVITENSAPIIESVTVDSTKIDSGVVNFIVNATDLDNDILTFVWSCGDGSIRYDDISAEWFAPGDSGTYTITVKALDENGGSDIMSTIINTKGVSK